MADFEFDTSVEQIVIEFEDSMENVIDIEVQENIEVELIPIGGSGGAGGLISTIKVNGEKKNLTTEPVVRPIEGGYNIEFNNQDVSIKT